MHKRGDLFKNSDGVIAELTILMVLSDIDFDEDEDGPQPMFLWGAFLSSVSVRIGHVRSVPLIEPPKFETEEEAAEHGAAALQQLGFHPCP